MKKNLLTILSTVALCSSAAAQSQSFQGGILLGGGYLEDPDSAFAYGQLRGTFYEDDQFAHTIFLEVLGHDDDATLFFDDGFGSTFIEDGDITFINVTINYELEVKLGGPISAYLGGGVGVETISLDDRFDFEVDSDTNFAAQVFFGLRANFDNGFQLQAGARYLFREDFSLLGDQFVTNDTFGFEVSAGFQF